MNVCMCTLSILFIKIKNETIYPNSISKIIVLEIQLMEVEGLDSKSKYSNEF